MTDEQIISELKSRLNKAGAEFGISFRVLDKSRPDGDWTQFFVEIEDNGKRAAAGQILADVESALSDEAKRELLLIRVKYAKMA